MYKFARDGIMVALSMQSTKELQLLADKSVNTRLPFCEWHNGARYTQVRKKTNSEIGSFYSLSSPFPRRMINIIIIGGISKILLSESC